MKYLGVLLVAFSSAVYGGGWSNAAIPTQIDIERGGGFMVYGSFGNAGGCTVADRIYVLKGHPQYKEIYSAVLAAFTSGKKVQIYVHSCGPVSWYSVSTTTYNFMDSASALMLSN